MPVTGWPTEAAAGQVATEDRWIQMARLWAPEGVVAGVAGGLAPSFSAGQVTIQPGAAWINGHYAVNDAAAVVPVTGDGIVVLRYTLAGSLFTIAFVAGATNPTQTTAVWEIVLAQMTGGVMTDRRTIIGSDLTGRSLGYTQRGSDVSGIGATPVDIPNLAIAATVTVGRRILITARVGGLNGTVAGDRFQVSIKEGATQLARTIRRIGALGAEDGAHVETVQTPTAGAHTYKVTVERLAGTGTVTWVASPNDPSFILVEDVGPV